MKNPTKISLFLLVLVGCQQFALSTATIDSRIIQGSVALTNQTKHQVSVRLKRYDSPFGNGHICGGSLIGPNKVLTAAHCLYNAEKKKFRKANEFVVVMGTLNRYQRVNGTIVSNVQSIAYMNTFSLDTMRDDVGVMFLKDGLPPNRTHLTVQPIALSDQPTPAGVACQVSGWGMTEKGSMSPVLLIANVSTIQRAICRVAYSSLKEGMICAGHLLGGTDSCQGDSGGPLVVNNTLIGVVSWGSGCAEPGFPGVYADVQYYRNWIMSRNGAARTHLGAFLLTTLISLWIFKEF